MSKTTQRNQLGPEFFSNSTLPHTRKFAFKQLGESKTANTDLMNINSGNESHKGAEENAQASRDGIESTHYAISSLVALLNRQVHFPKRQTSFVTLGSGVVLRINNRKETQEFIVDTVSVGNTSKIIALNSPLGKALYGKKVGDTGYYTVGKKRFWFVIVEIKPYDDAKKILKLKKGKKILMPASAAV